MSHTWCQVDAGTLVPFIHEREMGPILEERHRYSQCLVLMLGDRCQKQVVYNNSNNNNNNSKSNDNDSNNNQMWELQV